MSFPVNAKCPCGSGLKYKKCCMAFHKGAKAKNALELMKSRYCAYAAGELKYIMNTTHKENKDYNEDKNEWGKSIKTFSDETDFEALTILDFVDGENEAYVTFKAKMSSGGADVSFTEKSRFLKVDGKWLYESGVITNAKH